jgi:hypothetical protein
VSEARRRLQDGVGGAGGSSRGVPAADSSAATLFSVSTLRRVVTARAENLLPGSAQVYDTSVLTEDNDLRLALLHLG